MDREKWNRDFSSDSGTDADMSVSAEDEKKEQRDVRAEASSDRDERSASDVSGMSVRDGGEDAGRNFDSLEAAGGRTEARESDGAAEVDYSRAAGIREAVHSADESAAEGNGQKGSENIRRTSSAWSSGGNFRGNGNIESNGSVESGQNGQNRQSGSNGIYGSQNGQQSVGDFSRYAGSGDGASSSGNRSAGAGERPAGASYETGTAHGDRSFVQNQPGGMTADPGKMKKEKKPMGRGTKAGIAVVLVIVLAFAAGFGGGAAAVNMFGNTGGGTGQASSNISIDSSEGSLDAASVIAEKVMPSVVGISTVSQTYRQSIFGLQQGTTEGSGTGFIVDEGGYILTNAHVVESSSSSSITVDLYDGSEYEGTVLWSDTTLDLAIVKIDATNLQAVDLGDSDDVKIGDYAVAIGNPLGKDFERSVTQGIISGLDRSITTTDSTGQSQNNMQGLIQTDASINSGNSGGPLINSSGDVIGINTAKASSAEGLGFAIPINTALPIIEEIKENGTYEQVYLGITGMNVEDAVAQYQTDFKAEKGVVILQIYTESAALEAGMKEGDIITAIDGDAIDNLSDLKKKLVGYRPGDKITVSIERNKEDQTLELTLKAQDTANTTSYKSADGSSGNGASGSGGSLPDDNSQYGSQGSGSWFDGIFGN